MPSLGESSMFGSPEGTLGHSRAARPRRRRSASPRSGFPLNRMVSIDVWETRLECVPATTYFQSNFDNGRTLHGGDSSGVPTARGVAPVH